MKLEIGLLKALNAMDKASQTQLKNDVYSISSWVAGGIKTSAYVGARFPALVGLPAICWVVGSLVSWGGMVAWIGMGARDE
mgnify:CR=1 FL=1